MRYSIGLDLGINNVGWAVYDLISQEIIDKGVVRYKESSDAQDRRGIRGSRRLNKRRHHRVERLAVFLNSISFNTKRTYEVDLLEKRILGLSEKLSEQEITNIIYYFAIHRGYIPFDDEKTDREVYDCKENEYPCQYIKEFYSDIYIGNTSIGFTNFIYLFVFFESLKSFGFFLCFCFFRREQFCYIPVTHVKNCSQFTHVFY